MRRPLWSRALAALLAVWFAIVMAEPAALHSCPMHGGPAVAAASGGHHAAPAPEAAASIHAAARHGMAHHGAPVPADRGAGHQCTCLGRCAAGVGAAAPAARVVLAQAVETAAARDSGLPDHEYVPVAAAHVLPFANGPPTVA